MFVTTTKVVPNTVYFLPTMLCMWLWNTRKFFYLQGLPFILLYTTNLVSITSKVPFKFWWIDGLRFEWTQRCWFFHYRSESTRTRSLQWSMYLVTRMMWSRCEWRNLRCLNGQLRMYRNLESWTSRANRVDCNPKSSP
jgi:hypothetical protein